jgi:uncharacterized Fe-S cluster protein YjdI
MSDYDRSEFLVLLHHCRDGELTYHELYKLAEWLSNHREACVRWPGDLLVKSLQKAWADSKITKSEARQVARVILHIRKEAAKTRGRGGFCSGSRDCIQSRSHVLNDRNA